MTASKDPKRPLEPAAEAAGSESLKTKNASPAETLLPTKRRHGIARKVVTRGAIVLVLIVIVLLASNAIMTHFITRPYRVPSESMEPTLHGCAGCTGDVVMVDELAYNSSSPQPGDVIVFKAPPSWNVGYKSIRSDDTVVRWTQNVLSVLGFAPPDENDLVKRVIAIAGQTIQCRADTGLTVDGKPLTEPYLNATTMMADPAVYPCLGSEFGPATVPPGRLWVMGDNRTHSADSRAHCPMLCTGDPTPGTVPVYNVIGRVSSVRIN